MTTDSVSWSGRIFFFHLCSPLPQEKSCLVMGFLGKIQTQGTVKSLAKEDLVFPMEEKGSLSSSSLFGILEVDSDTMMSWKTDAMEDLKQVGLFVFQYCLDWLWQCIQTDKVGCAWRILMRVIKIAFTENSQGNEKWHLIPFKYSLRRCYQEFYVIIWNYLFILNNLYSIIILSLS